jgi:hypothetical protein
MENFDLKKYLAENQLTSENINEEEIEEGWKQWVAGGLLAATTLAGIGKAYAPKIDQLDSGDEIELAQNAYADAFKKMSNEDVDSIYTQVYKSDIKGDLKQNKFSFTSDTDKETRDAAWPDMQRSSLENAVAKNIDRFVIDSSGVVTFIANPAGFTALEESKPMKKTMKKSELKEMIKSAFVAETQDEETETADQILARIMGTEVDPYMAEGEEEVPENPEDYTKQPGYIHEEEEEEKVNVKVKVKDEEDVDVDAGEEIDAADTDLSADDEEVESANDSIVIDKKIVSLSSLPGETRKILDSLETLRAQAEEFGDQKFITQVGNTITFFTRDFVVAGEAPNPNGIEEGDGELDVNIDSEKSTAEMEAGLGLEESTFPMWNKIK